MAKFHKNGTIRGRIGNFVYSAWKNTGTIKAMPTKVKRPNTIGQRSQTSRIRMASHLIGELFPILKTGYQAPKVCQTGMNEARSYFYRNIVVGTYPDQYIDYSKVIVSRGQIPAPFDLTVAFAERQLTLTWNTSIRNPLTRKEDFMAVMFFYPGIYNPKNKTSTAKLFYDKQTARRKDGTVTVTVPNDHPMPSHCWIFFYNPEKATGESQHKISDSIYLGEFSN